MADFILPGLEIDAWALISLMVSSLEVSGRVLFSKSLRYGFLPLLPGPATWCSISKLDGASIRGLLLVIGWMSRGAMNVLGEHIATVCTEVLICSYSGPKRRWMALAKLPRIQKTGLRLCYLHWLSWVFFSGRQYRLNPSIQECWWRWEGLKVQWPLEKNMKLQ